MAKDYLDEPKKKSKKGRAGSFFLGWFLSIIFNIALFGGLGYWAYKNVTLSSVEKTFGFNVSALSGDIKNMTLDKLLTEVVDVASNYDSYTIEEIADKVGLDLSSTLTVEGTGDTRVYKYKTIDLTGVVKGKLKEVGTNMQSVVGDISLRDIEEGFEVTLPNYEFLNSLKDTPLKDLNTATDGIFDSYTLNKLKTEFGVDFSSVSMLESLLDTPFSDLPNEFNELLVSDVLDTTSATGVLKAIKDFKVVELGDKIETLKISELFEEADLNGNNVLKALKDSTINNLSDSINDLTIAEIYPDSTNRVIQAISTYKVTNLTQAFDELTIGDVIDMEKKANNSYQAGSDPAYKQYEAQGVWAFIDETTTLNALGGISLDLSEVTLGKLQYQGLVDQTLNLTKSYKSKALSEYTINELLTDIVNTAS